MTTTRVLELLTSNTPVLVRGFAASGKSAILADVREKLGDAIVVDDAHRLTVPELTELTRTVESAAQAVVIAAEPRPHHDGLRALTTAILRKGSVLDLPALTAADVAALADRPISRTDAETIAHLSGGGRGCVLALLGAQRDGNDLTDAAGAWIRERLRRADPDFLATLALAASGAGLDPADVADVLGVDPVVGAGLVDAVRACGLLADSDVLRPAAIEPLRATLGTRRFAGLQSRLLEVLLDAGTLRPDVAVAFVDLGVRDERLAEFLIAHAAVASARDATDLYGAGSAQYNAVAAAWSAVSVN